MKLIGRTLTIAAIILTGTLHAVVPRLVNYQGRLAVQGVNFEGTGLFKFALVDAAGATTYWSNDGTSAGGSEPVNAVSLPVSKGLYSVLLGDVALANMTSMPAVAFSNADVRLRVWFNDGAAGSQLLAPDQRLAPASYLADGAVTAAAIADASIVAAKIAPGAIDGTRVATASLDFSRLQVANAPAAGQVLGFDGAGLNWASGAAGGGDSVFSLNGTSAYYLGGNVGLGTSTPTHRLTLAGGPEWTSNGWLGSIALPNASAIGWAANTAGQRFGMGHTNTGFAMFRTASDPGTAASPALYDLFINDAGNVGLGTLAPGGKLEIAGAQDALRITGYQPFMTFRDSSLSNARGSIQSVGGDMNIFTESYLSGANGFSFLKVANNGNVGIGSPTPVGKLEVVAQDALRLIGYQPFLTLLDSAAGYARGRIQSVGGEMIFMPESYLNNSDGNAYAKLFNSGNLSVKTLTIRGGADLAEPFEFSAGEVGKGAVVIIDSHQPGKLTLSHKAYDKHVAGVVSGANGINPGISLQQDGLLEGGQNVALTGRVYVQADATFGAIEPGDLLTSSDTPGHAMKVMDPARAQGAILGKAMSALEEGQGMVLILVTLQ